MSRYHSYINSATRVLEGYDGKEPFARHIRDFFSSSKKYGSKDRKMIAHLCYCFFRPGKSLQKLPVGEQLVYALYLCSTSSHPLLKELRPDLDETTGLSLKEKSGILSTFNISAETIFPEIEQLGELTNAEEFILSHFVQPDLFLRARPGKTRKIEDSLADHNIPYRMEGTTFTLPNNINIDSIIKLNDEAVVQDLSSQRIAYFFSLINREDLSIPLKVWDCCAASGGKSLLAYDTLKKIDLTVSDIRESIISNLEKRFRQAGITGYRAFVADLTKPGTVMSSPGFDLIIADVPCSGSGTWGRTPEQLYYFEEEKISYYSGLQRKVTSNVLTELNKDGHLLYITCSVFRKENEDNVTWLLENHPLQLVEMKTLEGYREKADSMFAALLKRTG